MKDQSSEQASPLLLQDRPRLSLGTRISRRTSQSPASPQFKQAEHATSLDPITFHSIARASSEGEALKAVSQRQLRESNRNLGSMERPPPEQPQSARNSNPNSNPYASTYARIPVDGHQTDKPYGQLVDSPERLSLASSSPEQEQRTLEAAVANLDIADAEEAPTEATELGSEAKAAKRSLFSRLRFSRSVSSASSSATPIASPQRSRLPSYSYANSSRMAPNPSSHSRVVSAAAQTLDTPNNNTDSKPSKRLSISSVSTHDSDALSTAAQQTPFKTPPRPKVHRIKTKVKHKEVREFGHLFLAQELRLDPPKSPHSLESKVSPSVDTASFSNPLDSATSLPLSSTHPSVDNFQSPPVTSTASVNGRKKQAVWAMEFSQDGQYLAAAGHDAVVRVWKVLSSDSQPHPRPGSEQECLADDAPLASAKSNKSKTPKTQRAQAPVFESAPLKEFVGHTGDVLDLRWAPTAECTHTS